LLLALITTSSDDDDADASVIVVGGCFAKADDTINESFLHLQLEGIHIA
jgi:hypothetical protein